MGNKFPVCCDHKRHTYIADSPQEAALMLNCALCSEHRVYQEDRDIHAESIRTRPRRTLPGIQLNVTDICDDIEIRIDRGNLHGA